MHFRVRQRVVQLIRTVYDPIDKKPKASVVGRLNLDAPELSSELRLQLSEAEVREAEAWITTHQRTTSLREEFAALTLSENLRFAQAWFEKNRATPEAAAVVSSLIPVLHDFRKALRDVQIV